LPLPLPMPAQPATLTATRVATKATSTFFIGIPLFHATRYTLRASLHRWSPAEANGSPAPETVGHFKRDCVLGDTVTRRAQENLPESGSRSAPRHPPPPVYFRAEFEGRRLRQGKLRPADSCAVVQHSINRPPTSESGHKQRPRARAYVCTTIAEAGVCGSEFSGSGLSGSAHLGTKSRGTHPFQGRPPQTRSGVALPH
jgi:hypothetical protein